MRIKICGIRTPDDLDTAVAAGAHAVGFLVGLTHESEDELDPLTARDLIRRVPPFVQPVLVTHLTQPREITNLTNHLEPGAVQLHGELSDDAVDAVRQLLPRTTLIRALHVTPHTSGSDLCARTVRLARVVDAVLLDTRTADRLGGTGQIHDWGISRRVVESSPVPIILAGGLTSANVELAVNTVRPWAVDVNSGVEDPSGDKAALLCNEFVIRASSAEAP